MSAETDPVVRFGAFELDLRTGELRKSGVRVSLPDQPFQVLKALLDRPGDLVTREELRQRLWPAETFVDFEHGLNAAVRRLRDALGDSAEASRFVETLPRRGYRFIAPVASPSAAASPTQPSAVSEPLPEAFRPSAAPPGPRPVPARNTVLVAASVLAALVVVGASALLAWRFTTPSATASRTMLAVLPFDNLTGDASQEYISDGMTDELIAQLGAIDPSRLGVIARRSAMQFKNTPKRADQIGVELGASHLLEGSVRRTGSRIRVAVQLVDTTSESQLWAEQYEREAQDLLTLQREIGSAVSRQIAARLGVAAASAAAETRRHSTNTTAYDHYLRGRYHWRKETVEGFEKAAEHFRSAMALDESYAQAYSGLADTYTALGSAGFLPMREAYPRAREAALKAIEFDATLAEAHASLAGIASEYDWDWATADRHFKRAIELSPNYEPVLRWYSSYLACMGRHDEALGLAQRARDLDPASPSARYNLGMTHYFARRYDDAITQFREMLDLDPGQGAAHVMLGRIYVATGQADRAVEELAHARRLLGGRPDVITPSAYVLARAGHAHEARAALQEMRRPTPFRVAYVHIGLGETDQAFEWLEKAIDARDWQMRMLKVEPAFDGMRSDPRFTSLLGRVGLTQ